LTAAEQKEEDKFMNEQTKSESKPDDLTKTSDPRSTESESKPDDLTKTTDPASTELTAEELEQVSGGTVTFLRFD